MSNKQRGQRSRALFLPIPPLGSGSAEPIYVPSAFLDLAYACNERHKRRGGFGKVLRRGPWSGSSIAQGLGAFVRDQGSSGVHKELTGGADLRLASSL